jgi:thioredoxin-related protein
MKTSNMRNLLAVFLFGLSFVAWADPPPDYPFVSYDKGLTMARETGKPIFLYFGRYGCAWCDHTNKQSFSNAELK